MQILIKYDLPAPPEAENEDGGKKLGEELSSGFRDLTITIEAPPGGLVEQNPQGSSSGSGYQTLSNREVEMPAPASEKRSQKSDEGWQTVGKRGKKRR